MRYVEVRPDADEDTLREVKQTAGSADIVLLATVVKPAAWHDFGLLPQQQELVREALEIFFDLRKVPGLKKKPSTSEVLDWLKLLLAEDLAPEDLRRDGASALPKLHGALLKNEQDVALFERLAFRARGGRRV